MYEVNYNGWTPSVSNYFYRPIRLEGSSYDAECDLLTIAKFLVFIVSNVGKNEAKPAVDNHRQN